LHGPKPVLNDHFKGFCRGYDIGLVIDQVSTGIHCTFGSRIIKGEISYKAFVFVLFFRFCFILGESGGGDETEQGE
jgi:hypothetical protein